MNTENFTYSGHTNSVQILPSTGRYAKNKIETINSFVNFSKGLEFPKWPLEIFLELSNVCDLKCAMCPTFSALNPSRGSNLKNEERGFLDATTLSKPLEEVLAHALNVHCFGYGEPTIHPQFQEFITYISQFEVLIDFFSNGMHLDEHLANFLVEKNIFSLSISFSGTTKEEYENIYLGGIFEKVLSGIKNIANAKQKNNSLYPLIEINSLAFNHHVMKLDSFVDLMAAHGANVIHLKTLQAHTAIPQLAQHVSVLRPWIEGPILERARKCANQNGVILSTTQYDLTLANSEEEASKNKKNCLIANGQENDTRLTELVQIGKFKELAKTVRAEQHHTTTHDTLSHQSTPLEFDDYQGKLGNFYCLEPFKTLYVRKDGKTKPCCFSNNEGPILGNLNLTDASQIWTSSRANAIRHGVLNQSYSKSLCGNCIKHQFGPKEHYVSEKIKTFSEWYKVSYRNLIIENQIEQIEGTRNNKDIIINFKEKAEKDLRKSNSVTEINISLLSAKIAMRELRDEPISDLIAGNLEFVKDGLLFGWAWTPCYPESNLDIIMYDNGIEIGRIKADAYRGDILNAGIGNGCYGFKFQLPDKPVYGKSFSLRAQINQTAFFLRSEPLIYTSPTIVKAH